MTTIALRLRQYGRTAAMAATGVADSPLFLFDYLLRLLRVAVLLAIWRVILGHGGAGGMTLAAVLTYTLVSEAFAEQLDARTQLVDALWQGSITMYLLQPISAVESFAADMGGRWAFGLLLFTVPLLLCAPVLGVDPRPADALAAVLFVPSVALAVCVGLALEFVFAALTIALEQGVWVVAQMRAALTTVLSGSLLPLALLPWGLGNVFAWLPFASMASAPLRIYTGTGDPGPLLLGQAAWAVLLWPLARWMWLANRQKLVGYGG